MEVLSVPCFSDTNNEMFQTISIKIFQNIIRLKILKYCIQKYLKKKKKKCTAFKKNPCTECITKGIKNL